ncbi:MAG: 3'-5' exonuclease, partial [Chloroflexi bacterium]|nr:3'-5' exonuclease [Chloroflexota bacterium]
WSRRKLSKAQISYAATDAWVSLELFKKLDQENLV